VIDSYPSSATTWACTCSSTGSLTAAAVCLTDATLTELRVPGSGTSAPCLTGQIIGGGCAGGGAPLTSSKALLPSQVWQCSSGTAYALCAQ
jgi:hypothetical protein